MSGPQSGREGGWCGWFAAAVMELCGPAPGRPFPLDDSAEAVSSEEGRMTDAAENREDTKDHLACRRQDKGPSSSDPSVRIPSPT